VITVAVNRSKPRIPVAERQRARKEKEQQQERARLQLEALLQASKIERMTQAEILEDLKSRYPGGLPVPLIWNHIADRRITIHGAGPLAARG
jgi:hypothetical protein